MTSNVIRRTSVRRSARGNGPIPAAASRSLRKASMIAAPTGPSSPTVAGTVGRTSGWNDHRSIRSPRQRLVTGLRGSSQAEPTGLPSLSSGGAAPGHGAPAATHASISPISSPDSGSSGGIGATAGSCRRTARTRRLASASPKMTAGPVWPPRANAAASSSASPPCGSCPAWHSRQRTARSFSTRPAGAPSSAPALPEERNASSTTAIRPTKGWGRVGRVGWFAAPIAPSVTRPVG